MICASLVQIPQVLRFSTTGATRKNTPSPECRSPEKSRPAETLHTASCETTNTPHRKVTL